jgi:ribosomal protein uL24
LPATSWKSFAAKLSPGLIEEHNIRSIPVRSGDTVTVMRGSFRDVEGKVTRISRKKTAIFIEGITREKADGNTIFIPIHPSKVMITKLNLDDDWRKDILTRRGTKLPTKINVKPKMKKVGKPRKKTVTEEKKP